MKLKAVFLLPAIFLLAVSTAQASTISGSLPNTPPGTTWTYYCQGSTENVIAILSASGAASITVTAGTGSQAQSETSTDGSAEATASGIGNAYQTCTYVYPGVGGTQVYSVTVTNN